MVATFLLYLAIGALSPTVYPQLTGAILLLGPFVIGVPFAILEWRDVSHLRSHGVEFGKWRYPFYIVTTFLPIAAAMYWWERKKLVRNDHSQT